MALYKHTALASETNPFISDIQAMDMEVQGQRI